MMLAGHGCRGPDDVSPSKLTLAAVGKVFGSVGRIARIILIFAVVVGRWELREEAQGDRSSSPNPFLVGERTREGRSIKKSTASLLDYAGVTRGEWRRTVGARAERERRWWVKNGRNARHAWKQGGRERALAGTTHFVRVGSLRARQSVQ